MHQFCQMPDRSSALACHAMAHAPCRLLLFVYFNTSTSMKLPWSVGIDCQQVVQQGKGQDMVFGPDACLKHISEHFPLCEGDVIMTGVSCEFSMWRNTCVQNAPVYGGFNFLFGVL